MYRFWDNFISPLLSAVKPGYIVEIGSENGYNTEKILKYCANNGAKLSCIDPGPLFDVEKVKQKYGETFDMRLGWSLEVLPKLKDYGVILIDGDHNWYTVYNELKVIENGFLHGDFPLVLIHDVDWPYARRDGYYFPDTIPDEYRKPCEKKCVFFANHGLVERGGINGSMYNALEEGGLCNGVLTAIEDFIGQSSIEFSYTHIAGNSGLGILTTQKSLRDNFKLNELLREICLPEFLSGYYEGLAQLTYKEDCEISKLYAEIEIRGEEISRCGEEIHRCREEIDRYRKEISSIKNSHTWKLASKFGIAYNFIVKKGKQ